MAKKSDDDGFPDLFGFTKESTVAYARTSDPETAKTAARKISFTPMQYLAFKAYKATGKPMTSLCVTRWLIENGGLTDERQAWSVSPRIPELVRLGAIVLVGDMTVVGTNGNPSRLQAHVIHPDFANWEPPSNLPFEPTPVEEPPTNAYYDEGGRLLKNGCPVCGADPSLSIGFFPRKGLLGMWYCKDHWPGWAKLRTSGMESGDEISPPR